MGHKYSDLDSVGSSVGLTCAIRNLGKSAWAVRDYSTSLAKVLIGPDSPTLTEKNRCSQSLRTLWRS